MKRSLSSHFLAALFLAAMLASGHLTAEPVAPRVAGLRPFERPAEAPRIAAFTPDAAWSKQAKRGLGEPATGLGFLADQGAWYTPFNRPNLTGRYDWRGLHRPAAKD